MIVNIRLKEVLKSRELDCHGVINEIAEAIKVDRHIISNLYNNRAQKVSLKVLGKIATWLERQGVRSDELLGTIFDTQPSRLWDAIAAKETVTIYLGEYQQTRGPAAAWRWISRRDAATAAHFVQQLSAHSYKDAFRPQFKFEYVPFRFVHEHSEVNQDLLKGDIKRTGGFFLDMTLKKAGNALILVGSQRVNYLLEYYVSNLFGCKPFYTSPDKIRVPFYFVYRDTDHKIPSCFGGVVNPYHRKDEDAPGLHYLISKTRWATCRWKEFSEDAGVVIIVNDPRVKSTEIAVFGFSGRATEAIGDELLYKEDIFWPPSVVIKGREIGVYICVLSFSTKKGQRTMQETVKTDKCKVIPLSEKLLKEFVR